MADEKRAQPASDEAPKTEQPLTAEALLRYSVQLFAQFAWQRMGYLPDPATEEVTQDLKQARIAIDTVSNLIDSLVPLVSDQEARTLRNLLSDLRMNFARKSANS